MSMTECSECGVECGLRINGLCDSCYEKEFGEPYHKTLPLSLNDITGLARQIATAICARQGLNPDERDGYGKYHWESFVAEARKSIQLVRAWDEKHQTEQPLGSPVRYNDGTYSREYDEQPACSGYSEKNERISDGVRQYGREINLPPLDVTNVYTDQVRQREIPVLNDRFFSELAAGLLVDYSKGGYHKWTCDYIKRQLRPYLRTPEAVSVSLEKCAKAIFDEYYPNGYGKTSEFEAAVESHKANLRRNAKAVLTAAGVKYHE